MLKKLLILATCGFLISCQTPPEVEQTDWLPFVFEDGHIKVPTEIRGVKAYALIDTASDRSSVNEAFIDEHAADQKVQSYVGVEGLFAHERREIYSQVPFTINGNDFTFDLMEISFGPPRNALLLGADFLKHVIVDIDYPNKRIRFLPRSGNDIAASSNVTVAKQRGTGLPIVRVGLNGEDERWVIMDTGYNGGVLLERRVASSNDWFTRYRSKATLVMGVNSMGYQNELILPTVSIGPYELQKVSIAFPEHIAIDQLTSQYREIGSRFRGHRIEGRMGSEVLKEFRIVLDYRGGFAEFIRE